MANTVSVVALRQEVWGKDLYQDSIDALYFMKNGMMGKGINNIVELKEELTKEPGDTATFGLTGKMSGDAILGDNEAEGNEEAILSYDESVAIDQARFAVRMTGRLDEREVTYDMRKDAKDKLIIRRKEFLERQIFLKLGGVDNVLLNDVNLVTVGAQCTWSNTPDYIPDAHEAAGTGARYLCANSSGTDALTVADLITPGLIQKVKTKAKLASPMINPVVIDGINYYVLFVHPWQGDDLRSNATWSQAMREAELRGKENPIFSGSLGVWGGVIVHEHEYVPFLDVSVAGNSFRGAAVGTDCLVDCFRALLCGQQAVGLVECQNENEWVEKTFDYNNKRGVCTSIIGGLQKMMFNSKEFGVIALDTYGTAQ